MKPRKRFVQIVVVCFAAFVLYGLATQCRNVVGYQNNSYGCEMNFSGRYK